VSTETAKEADLAGYVFELQHTISVLREALDRAGTRLAQVQPAIDPACGWALGIVPKAEWEIADVLKETQ
jgi:hypothetical protein